MNVTLILKIDYCLKPFYIQHSAFSILHSAFSIQHSTFSIQHSAFNIQHSQNLTDTFAASKCPNFS